MYEKIEHCPVCKTKKFENYLITKDYMVSNESFAIQKCEECDFIFTNPRPNKEEISKYYESNKYISHTNKAINPIQLIYKLVRKYTLYKKGKLIYNYIKPNSLLDYGCGTGDFINYINKKNIKTIGIEPDKLASTISKNKGLSIYNTLEEIPEDQPFDVITLWHVLEHIHQLEDIIEKLKNLLSAKGIMIVALPNYESYDATYYKEYWAGWDVPRHLYHFSKKTLTKLFNSKKLKIKEIKPMIFDSYYVSLLSEGYKTNKTNPFKAFLTGHKSNKLAKQNNNYSSLIYIIQK
ncbi:MAG: class I SAM-dependent methyltransferase [Cyclobacteriaceae bacterium]|nr:class I SAM-dependent methyltransferase [Cyclobacteriaceae bacterium]